MQIPESHDVSGCGNWRAGRLKDLAKPTQFQSSGAKVWIKTHGGSNWVITKVMNVTKGPGDPPGAGSHGSSYQKARQANLSHCQSIWHKADQISSTYPHFPPFIHSLSICSCDPNPRLGWFFKGLKMETPVPHQAILEAISLSPFSRRHPWNLLSPNKVMIKSWEKPLLISENDFPADNGGALLSPEAHKHCKLSMWHN